MVSTWIEAPAKGRHGGPVRAGMWSAVVIGTHPIESGQEVWLELEADEVILGSLPAYWLENKGVNSLWHVPIPPQAVGARLHYRSVARLDASSTVSSPYQDTMVRPNLPERIFSPEIVSEGPEGLVGNRMMTARVDGRGSTYDIYFPTVGLHSDVRPAEGDQPQSRSHFRGIVGGLAVGRRLDWFTERLSWSVFQHYQGATNLLQTELNWRHGPLRVIATDFVVAGKNLPTSVAGVQSSGQYIKRFRIVNDGDEALNTMFGVYVQAEVNGGIGETSLSWHDGDRTLLATNRGHGHSNRKLARDSTVEFAIALDGRGAVHCEPTATNEAILFRKVDLPPHESVTVDLLVSGAFTGWRGDTGTFEHWLRPALAWFRSSDLDGIEQSTAAVWDDFVEPLPSPNYSKPSYGVTLRRSALAAALHADAQFGAIASGFDRGLHAYCWPRDAIWAAASLDRLGHVEIGKALFRWLARAKGRNRPYAYWYQKYTIDGLPEWETPAVDQTAIIPFAIEQHYRRTGDISVVAANWSLVEQAATVCIGPSGHPGLKLITELSLVSSSNLWDHRYGAFTYSNASVVAGLRASARLARVLDKGDLAERWEEFADRIWSVGILGESVEKQGCGLVDPVSGRFLDGRRLSKLRGLWTENPDSTLERSAATDVSVLGLVVPFKLLPASDQRVRRTADAILLNNAPSPDPNLLMRWTPEPHPDLLTSELHQPTPALMPRVPTRSPSQPAPIAEPHQQDLSSLATLWMTRYLIQLGKATGQAAHWNRAQAMLDATLARLGPLGLNLRHALRGGDLSRFTVGSGSGVWGLHSMLVETLLDFAGLDYDAVDRVLTLSPALPTAWPHVGLAQTFPCGSVSYRFDRLVGGLAHRLIVLANLKHPIKLEVSATCPGLFKLEPWRTSTQGPLPRHDPVTGEVSWTVELDEGESNSEWSWG